MTLRWLLALPIALAAATPAMAQEVPGGAVPGIKAQLEASVAIKGGMLDSAEGWNEGDIDRFLAIYSDDPATSFTGSEGINRGKAAVRARYVKSYPDQFGASRAKASKLSFTFEDFRLLGADHALLTARWKLIDAAGKELAGMTTLVFRHEAAGWKIIADHSS